MDGTLTPSRCNINKDFKDFFNNFCRENVVWLVTGSDKSKTVEQIGDDTYNMCHTVYNCNGNDVWQSRKNIFTNDWILPDDAHEWLTDQLTSSSFKLRTGMHFEHRPGMCNFSIVGRNATKEERAEYVFWDTKYNERDSLTKNFNILFPKLEATVGGETGIDIAPLGCDKSQITRDIMPNNIVYFFGDKMDPSGNDYPLKKKIFDNDLGLCYSVKGWKHTWELLENHE